MCVCERVKGSTSEVVQSIAIIYLFSSELETKSCCCSTSNRLVYCTLYDWLPHEKGIVIKQNKWRRQTSFIYSCDVIRSWHYVRRNRHFYLGRISHSLDTNVLLQAVSLCKLSTERFRFSMILSQHFRCFVVTKRVLFSSLMAEESFSREDKLYPSLGNFNFGNKSKSGGRIHGTCGVWALPCLHSNSDSVLYVRSCKMSTPVSSKLIGFLFNFQRTFCMKSQ